MVPSFAQHLDPAIARVARVAADAERVVDDIAVRRASGTVLPAPVNSNALVV